MNADDATAVVQLLERKGKPIGKDGRGRVVTYVDVLHLLREDHKRAHTALRVLELEDAIVWAGNGTITTRASRGHQPPTEMVG